MVNKLTEEIYFDDGSRVVRRHLAVTNGCVVEAGRYYSLELCRKPADFGGVAVDQFWMELNSIYGDRRRRARNHDVLVEYFWAQCMRAGTVVHDEVMNSYILAKILPLARRNGSRHIFNDAVLTAGYRIGEKKGDMIKHLETLLAGDQDGMLDIESFHRKTADLLGPPHLDPAVELAYRALSDELLGEGRCAIKRWGPQGLQVPIRKLQNWMATFARRQGNEDKKFALDILSYECRAAMHRCYSAVWFDLLLHLEKKYELDEASVQFHRLMHFDIALPSERPDANFYLFHGHVFALHPGIGLFMQTKKGGELVGDYLRGTAGDGPFRRLLNGFWIALCDYDCRRDRYAEIRSRIGCQVEDIEIGEATGSEISSSGRRGRFGPRKAQSNHVAEQPAPSQRRRRPR